MPGWASLPTASVFRPGSSQGHYRPRISVAQEHSAWRHTRAIAGREGAPASQFTPSAVSESISAVMTEEYLAERTWRNEKDDLKWGLD